MKIRQIVVATGNEAKFREIKEIFSDLNIRLSSLHEYVGCVEPVEESGATFYENARIKAEWGFSLVGKWTMADDSGLEVDALGGQPGVYSARYAGHNAEDSSNNRLLLRRLKNIESRERTARFRCVVVVAGAGEEIWAEGCCEGRIGFEPKGSAGFGYDPLFIPMGFDLTFAQLDSKHKHEISHRGKALRALKAKLLDYI